MLPESQVTDTFSILDGRKVRRCHIIVIWSKQKKIEHWKGLGLVTKASIPTFFRHCLCLCREETQHQCWEQLHGHWHLCSAFCLYYIILYYIILYYTILYYIMLYLYLYYTSQKKKEENKNIGKQVPLGQQELMSWNVDVKS